ncbi:TPA: hypothetical protein ACH7Q5_005422, partial [Escherichia coli]
CLHVRLSSLSDQYSPLCPTYKRSGIAGNTGFRALLRKFLKATTIRKYVYAIVADENHVAPATTNVPCGL